MPRRADVGGDPITDVAQLATPAAEVHELLRSGPAVAQGPVDTYDQPFEQLGPAAQRGQCCVRGLVDAAGGLGRSLAEGGHSTTGYTSRELLRLRES